MLEFLMTMVVIALIFIVATIAVALIAGGLIKAKHGVKKHTPNNVGSE